MTSTDNIDRELARLDARITLAIAELDRLREWQATVTAILLRLEPGGLAYEDLPRRLREWVSELQDWRDGVKRFLAVNADDPDDLPF